MFQLLQREVYFFSDTIVAIFMETIVPIMEIIVVVIFVILATIFQVRVPPSYIFDPFI
jgi:hypothetical protein